MNQRLFVLSALVLASTFGFGARARGGDPEIFMDVAVRPKVVAQGGAVQVRIALFNASRDPVDGQLWGALLHGGDVVRRFGPADVHLPSRELVTFERTLAIPPDADRGRYALVAAVGPRPGEPWARAGDDFLVVGPVGLQARVEHDRVPADRPVPIDSVLENHLDRRLDVVLFGKLVHDGIVVARIDPIPVTLAPHERKRIHLETPLPDRPPLGKYLLVLDASDAPDRRPWARAGDRFEVVPPRH